VGQTTAKIDQVFSTLSDPTTRDIFERIVIRPVRVEDLSSMTNLSPEALRGPLRELRQAQLVQSGPDGRLCVEAETLPSIRTYFDRLWMEASLGDAWIGKLSQDVAAVV
jgi:DNA-binding transcriptional ArsR family regulator